MISHELQEHRGLVFFMGTYNAFSLSWAGRKACRNEGQESREREAGRRGEERGRERRRGKKEERERRGRETGREKEEKKKSGRGIGGRGGGAWKEREADGAKLSGLLCNLSGILKLTSKTCNFSFHGALCNTFSLF